MSPLAQVEPQQSCSCGSVLLVEVTGTFITVNLTEVNAINTGM